MKYFIRGLMFLFFFNCLFACAQGAQSFLYDDKGKRDPFRALVDENGQYLLEEDRYYSSDELEVSGILWDPEGKSSALINNQIAAVGEVVFGFLVKDITKDAVTLTKDGKEYIIRLSIEQ
jgi:hypothetical protein